MEQRARGQGAALAWLAAAPLGVAVFFFGGVHTEVWAGLGALLAATLTIALARTQRAPQGPIGAALASIMALMLLTALPLLPVGPHTRAALQPGLAPLVNEALALIGSDTHALALDPHRALQAISRAAGALALGLTAATTIRTLRRSQRLGLAVQLIAAGAAVVAFTHRGVDASSIYGLGTVPVRPDVRPFFAPFVNPNHAGLLAAAAAPLAVAAGVGRPLERRIVPGIILALLVGAVIATTSRGAMGALVVGLGAWLVLTRSRRVAGLVFGAAVTGALVTAGVGFRATITWLTAHLTPAATTPDPLGGRLDIWRDALTLIPGAPWVGVGPGGFPDAYNTVASLQHFTRTTHAHNEAVQAIVEHGLPVGIGWIALALAAVGWGVWRVTRLPRGKRRDQGAAWVAVQIAVLAGSVFDFPLRIGALALLFCAASGVHLGRWTPTRRRAPLWPLRLVGAGLIGGALLHTVPLVATTVAPHSTWASTGPALEELADAQGRQGTDPQAFAAGLSAATSVLSRRPLDHRGLLLLAQLYASAQRPAEALQTLDVAIRAWPALPSPWFLRARLLEDLGAQPAARVAWREGLSRNLPDNDDAAPWIAAALAREADPGAGAAQVIPARADRMRDAARYLVRSGDDLMAQVFFERAVALDPTTGYAYATQLLKWGDPDLALKMIAPLNPDDCGVARVRGGARLQQGQFEAATTAFARARALCGPDDWAARLGMARAWTGAGDKRAVALLQELVAERPESPGLRRTLIRAHRSQGQYPQLLPHLQALKAQGVATQVEQEQLSRLEAGLPIR